MQRPGRASDIVGIHAVGPDSVPITVKPLEILRCRDGGDISYCSTTPLWYAAKPESLIFVEYRRTHTAEMIGETAVASKSVPTKGPSVAVADNPVDPNREQISKLSPSTA